MAYLAKHKCNWCSDEYVAKSPLSKFCTRSCSTSASISRRQGRTGPAEPIVVGPLDPATAEVDVPTAGKTVIGRVEKVTRAQLRKVDRAETPLGEAALVLARRIDHSHVDSGSALAAMIKQLQDTLEKALEGTGLTNDPLDELRIKREQRDAG